MNKKIVFLALASMFLLSTVIGSQLIVTVLAQREPGVNVGDWALYSATYSGNVTLPPSDMMEWIITTVQEVSGTNVTFEATTHYADGNETTEINVVDVDTGQGNATGGLIAKDLNAGDLIYTSPSDVGSFGINFTGATINETIFRTYPVGILEVNHLNITASYTDPGTGDTETESVNCYWIRATGMLAEMSYYYLYQLSGGPPYLIQMDIEITDAIPEFPPALILPLFMIATIAAAFLGKAILSTKKLTRKHAPYA